MDLDGDSRGMANLTDQVKHFQKAQELFIVGMDWKRERHRAAWLRLSVEYPYDFSERPLAQGTCRKGKGCKLFCDLVWEGKKLSWKWIREGFKNHRRPCLIFKF